MKKLISMVALVVLVMTMAMGASAADPTGVVVLSFDNLEPGYSPTHNANGAYVGIADPGMAFDDQNKKDGTHWAAYVTSKGQSGNGLRIQAMNGTANHKTFIYLRNKNNSKITNWTGGQNLYFYIDASAFSTANPEMTIVLFEDVAGNSSTGQGCQFYVKSARHTGGATKDVVFVQDANGAWVSTPECATTDRFALPKGYKGWVKIPLTSASWQKQHWGSFDGYTIENKLSCITYIGYGFYPADADWYMSAMIDTFMVDGITAPTTTTAAPTTTTAAPTTTTVAPATTTTVAGATTTTAAATTTAKGSATGEAAIPALLLVALPVSAGVVFACKKRSK